MEKHISGLLISLSALFLLVGGLVGYNVGEAEVVIKEIPVEVEKLIPGEPIEIITEVEKDFSDYKSDAVELCLEEFIDGKTLTKYQTIEVLKVSDDWNIAFDKDITTTTLSIKFIKYDDLKDEDEKFEFKTCQVIDEDGEIEVIV